jgi:hypothetical protein
MTSVGLRVQNDDISAGILDNAFHESAMLILTLENGAKTSPIGII